MPKKIHIYIFTSLLIGIFISCYSNLFAQEQTTPHSIITNAKKQSKKKYLIPFANCANDLALLRLADSLALSTNDTEARAVINDQLGHCYAYSLPDSFTHFQLIAVSLFTKIHNDIRATYCIQNIAFMYEEQQNDIPNALKYSNIAVQQHLLRKDTVSIANMYKYIGMLKGKLGNHGEGLKDINLAIQYFGLKNNNLGIAVCYYDMALLYTEIKYTDSSIYYITKAKNIWQQHNGDISRIFSWNNKQLEIYLSRQDTINAKNIYYQNSKILEDNINDIQPNKQANYYKQCIIFHQLNKDFKSEILYKEKYENAIKSN
jgi:hypothetical protein